MAEIEFDECLKCGKNKIAKDHIEFKHKGFKVVIARTYGSCKDCTIKEWEEKFKEYGSQLLSFGKEIMVKWSFYKSKHRDEDKTKMNDILRSFGILSYKKEGNWAIVSDTFMLLNPSDHYFARKEDAILYAKITYPNTQYNWSIFQMENVIPRSSVLGLKK